MRCQDGRCYEDYSFCQIIPGCTNYLKPIMCPSGNCVADFEECMYKTYACHNREEERCGDGFCRENCDGIPTNGCPSHKPVYCQNGSCVESLSQCYDYRCTVHKPILCSNNRCARFFSDCPSNSLSTMVKKTEVEITGNKNSGLNENLSFTARSDSSIVKLRIKASKGTFFPPSYSAEYHQLESNGYDTNNVTLVVKPIPMSDLRDTKLRYLELDIDAEFITTRIFKRKISTLKPYQFLRSFIFQIRMNDYHFNQHLFTEPVEALFSFNHIHGFPQFKNFDIDGNEHLDAEDRNRDQFLNQFDQKIFELYPRNQPKLFYCLGMLNPMTNLWKCVNRKIKEITADSIVYDIPGPGIYSVLYFPHLYGFYNISCGFFCRNKREVLIVTCFLLPMVLIWGFFLFFSGKKLYYELLQKRPEVKKKINYPKKFKKLLKNMMVKFKENKNAKKGSTVNIRKMLKQQKAKAMSTRIIENLEKQAKNFEKAQNQKKKLSYSIEPEESESQITNPKSIIKEAVTKMQEPNTRPKIQKITPKSEIERRIDTFNNAIRNKDDFEQIKMILTGGEGDLKRNVFTYHNPLVYQKTKRKRDIHGLADLERRKLEQKMMAEHLMFEKFKQLQKMKYLREQIEDYTRMVKELRDMQGIDDLQREEDIAKKRDYGRKYEREGEKKGFKRMSFISGDIDYDRRNLHNFVLSKTGTGVGTTSSKPPYSRTFTFPGDESED